MERNSWGVELGIGVFATAAEISLMALGIAGIVLIMNHTALGFIAGVALVSASVAAHAAVWVAYKCFERDEKGGA